ncbi:hypothetical protein BDN67DRAFT_967977 [Paxillus ammoniavirescens]|nr:hypothetical protein BDN67DRAFT_967977 [Paxillus ammoniavirescens]
MRRQEIEVGELPARRQVSNTSFKTPATGGHHRDISDIGIEVNIIIVNRQVGEEDYAEIEYMPPT